METGDRIDGVSSTEWMCSMEIKKKQSRKRKRGCASPSSPTYSSASTSQICSEQPTSSCSMERTSVAANGSGYHADSVEADIMAYMEGLETVPDTTIQSTETTKGRDASESPQKVPMEEGTEHRSGEEESTTPLFHRLAATILHKKSNAPAPPKRRKVNTETHDVIDLTKDDDLVPDSPSPIPSEASSWGTSVTGTSTNRKRKQVYKSGVPQEKRPFGEIPGVSVGTIFKRRQDAYDALVHNDIQAGISGHPGWGGATAVCISGSGHYGDFDFGEIVSYVGSGGKMYKGTEEQPKNMKGSAPLVKDQQLEGRNLALHMNIESKLPVRVLRGHKLKSPYAPAVGYRYDGLYDVVNFLEDERNGCRVFVFTLKRKLGQPYLPINKKSDTQSFTTMESQPSSLSTVEVEAPPPEETDVIGRESSPPVGLEDIRDAADGGEEGVPNSSHALIKVEPVDDFVFPSSGLGQLKVEMVDTFTDDMVPSTSNNFPVHFIKQELFDPMCDVDAELSSKVEERNFPAASDDDEEKEMNEMEGEFDFWSENFFTTTPTVKQEPLFEKDD